MRSLLFLGGGLLIGVGVAWGEAYVSTGKKLQAEFEVSLESHKRVLERAAESYLRDKAEAPAATEEDLDKGDSSEDAITVGGEMVVETPTPEYVQQYVEQAQSYAAPENFVDVSPLQFIEAEDFEEEDDGRAKEQIQLFFGEGDPYFVQDGMVIEDWAEKIGDNIMVDFYQRFPPGSAEDQVLYIRNSIRGEDYEIVKLVVP